MALLPLPFANSVEYSRQDLGLQIKVAKTAYVLSRRVRCVIDVGVCVDVDVF